MQTDNLHNNKLFFLYAPTAHPWRILFLLYFLSVTLRFALAFFFRHGPTVRIDESLYINIAKSLAAGEGIAYRSQPVPYLYIFYPLLLAPLYLFPLPFDLYRAVQFYNTLLISTSVFPVYLFAKDFTDEKDTALLAAGITLLMPDLQMAGFQMSECVVWPLSLWLVFFAWRMFSQSENRIINGILVGVLTALLFWTKPGALALGLVLLMSALTLGEKTEIRQRRASALSGLSVCCVLILSFYTLYVFIFGYEFSLLGLYRKQLTVISLKWIAAVAEFSVFQLFLFAVSCSVIFFLIPYLCLKSYKKAQACFVLAFSLGMFAAAVGTAALVDMFQWNGSFTNPQLHLRYTAMFVPVMVVFSLAAKWPGESYKRRALIYLVCMAILMLFPGPSVGFVKDRSTYIDSISLSAWLKDFYIPPVAGLILSAAVVLFLSLVSLQLYRGRSLSGLKKQCVSFLILFLLYNNICGYVACNSHPDTVGYGKDACEMNSILEESSEDVLIVTQQSYKEVYSYYLESRIRKPYQQVTIDSLIEALVNTGGVYTPFFPEDQEPNVGNHITPDTSNFLFGAMVADHVEFSSSAAIQVSQNGWYSLVKIPNGERIVDTMLHGIDTQTLHEGEQATLYVFDETRYQKGKLPFKLVASAKNTPAQLLIENAGRQQTISLSSTPFEYKLSLLSGDTLITPVGGDVVILTYSTS